MVEDGVDLAALECLLVGVAMPLLEAIHMCRTRYGYLHVHRERRKEAKSQSAACCVPARFSSACGWDVWVLSPCV